MKHFSSYLFIFLLPMLFVEAQVNKCKYVFIDNNEFINLSSLIDINSILEANAAKEFYLALITLETGQGKGIKIKECSGISNQKAILFDGSIMNLDMNMLKFDSLILFYKIADAKKVTFEVSNRGGGNSHDSIRVLLCKIREKYIFGYSIDGCDLLTAFKEIINQYMVEEKGKQYFSSILNSY